MLTLLPQPYAVIQSEIGTLFEGVPTEGSLLAQYS